MRYIALFQTKETDVKQLVSKHRPSPVHHVERPLAPGTGLVIAGLASVALWAMIAGIAAIV